MKPYMSIVHEPDERVTHVKRDLFSNLVHCHKPFTFNTENRMIP